jgi:hypothetical protein
VRLVHQKFTDMKRFTLSVALLCVTAVSFAQILQTVKTAPSRNVEPDHSIYSPPVAKGGGDIIWETTFDWADPNNPRGWSLPEGWTVKDNSDLGNYWVWRNDTLKGNWTTEWAPTWFASGANGFICLPMDEYNSRDSITLENASDSYIETPPIDCSAYSSVVLRFSQNYRYCCRLSEGNLKVMITMDHGVRWTTLNARFDTGVNNSPAERYRIPEYNISLTAAGFSEVQIRFYMHGATHYYWMIDDLQLIEAFENEVVLEDSWMDFDGGNDVTVGHINYWPLSQMGMPGATSGTVGNYFFKAAVVNNGTADAEDAQLELMVLKNGTQVFSDLSPDKTIWTIERDTQKITNPYLVNDYGDYRFDFKTRFGMPDEKPENNTAKMYFTVTDTFAHRADFSREQRYNTANWVDHGAAGDMVGISYDIYAPCEINSITAYLYDFVAKETPQYQMVFLKDVDGEYTEWLTSEVKDMDSSQVRSWVTLPLTKDGEAEFLEPGNYAACVRMWGNDPEQTYGTPGMTVGTDLTTKESHGVCFVTNITDGATEWWDSGMLAMVGFTINASGGPTEAPVTFNVDMNNHIESGEFNPAADFVDVSGSFNGWTGSAHLADPEADGIYTITLDAMPVGKVIEYKYRINGDWNTSEYPNGGPNRKYTVRYWNVLNNVYNSGNTTGVDPGSLVASFEVYPNPASGAFTVEITNTVASTMVITLTNLQGQIVYRNQVKNALHHRETIGENLSKGLYFLSVNDGKEVRFKKIVVQ